MQPAIRYKKMRLEYTSLEYNNGGYSNSSGHMLSRLWGSFQAGRGSKNVETAKNQKDSVVDRNYENLRHFIAQDDAKF